MSCGIVRNVIFEGRHDIARGKRASKLPIENNTTRRHDDLLLTGSWEDGRREQERSRDRVVWHEAGPRCKITRYGVVAGAWVHRVG